jgi:NMD protein affecting ribosome stability and mRNA decay
MKRERGGFRGVQREQLLQGMGHDAYKAAEKLHEPTVCPECSAVFHRGRWSWAAAPEHAATALCPACRRIREHQPAGFVRLKGEFFDAHRDEVLKRVRHCEASEKREHPLQRIMRVEDDGDGLLVTTTDAHLARRIGDSLHDAYKGELKYRYSKDENLLRATWRR